MAAKTRLDSELVRRGLARSREHAQALVDSGRVRVGGLIATKPATAVDAATSVAVDESTGPDYVSRGGDKLAGALDAFGGPAIAGRRAASIWQAISAAGWSAARCWARCSTAWAGPHV